MTVVIERYTDSDGIVGEIMQDKFCKSYRMETMQRIDESRSVVLYRNTYCTIPDARRAMRRRMKKPIVRNL